METGPKKACAFTQQALNPARYTTKRFLLLFSKKNRFFIALFALAEFNLPFAKTADCPLRRRGRMEVRAADYGIVRGVRASRWLQEGAEASFAVCFAVIFVAGFAARCYGIANKPFWSDEATTIRRSGLPLCDLVRDSLLFHQLPAYYVVTSWVLPFGDTAFWVRLPAMLFGALSCALAFAVARSLGGMVAGLGAGLLVAFSPDMVQYGQDARCYSMLNCAILVALWGLLALARDPARAAKRFRATDGRALAWAAYGFGTVAALNLVADALLWLLASNLAAIAIARQGAGRGFWRNWCLVQVLILAACGPWFVAMMVSGPPGALSTLSWVPPMTWHRVWWTIAGDYFMVPTSIFPALVFSPGVPGLGFVVAAAGLAGVGALRRQPAVLAVLAAAALVPPLVIFAVSLVTPVLVPRYLLWGSLPVCLGAGLALGRLPARLQGPALVVLGGLALANLAPYYHVESNPRWDLAALDLQGGLQPGDLVVMENAREFTMLDFYCRRHPGLRQMRQWTANVPAALRWQKSGRLVWAVHAKAGQGEKLSDRQFVAELAGLGKPDLVERAGRDILIMRFDGGAE
jgi:4-amino-4-deoxy-L-arabinose transferase-like glycosyltransferase